MTFKSRIKKFLKSLGPGLITGAADDDPSGIGTYSQTGAQLGYTQLWTATYFAPFMITVQEMCGRIGLVTGKGLAGIIKKHYSKPLLYLSVIMLFIANTFNIGANLGAMAASAQLIIPLPFSFLLITITLLTLFLEIMFSYKTYSRYLKYLTISLLAYIFAAFAIKQDWGTIILKTLIPTIALNKEYIINIVAVLGTTLSPYLFFWQVDEEVEEEIMRHKIRAFGFGIPRVTKSDIKAMRIDTAIGMIFSCVVMFFIIVTTASTLHANSIFDIQTADQAAIALKPIAGNFAFFLFAIGIVGSGLLAVPILAGSAAYALAEAFSWKEGLYKKFNQARGFYGTIITSTLLGLLINYSGIKPFVALYWAAILNGIIAPFLLVMIIVIANNKKIMGNYTNKMVSNILGSLIIVIMFVASFALFLSLVY